jgi:hypothetical protein
VSPAASTIIGAERSRKACDRGPAALEEEVGIVGALNRGWATGRRWFLSKERRAHAVGPVFVGHHASCIRVQRLTAAKGKAITVTRRVTLRRQRACGAGACARRTPGPRIRA